MFIVPVYREGHVRCAIGVVPELTKFGEPDQYVSLWSATAPDGRTVLCTVIAIEAGLTHVRHFLCARFRGVDQGHGTHLIPAFGQRIGCIPTDFAIGRRRDDRNR